MDTMASLRKILGSVVVKRLVALIGPEVLNRWGDQLVAWINAGITWVIEWLDRLVERMASAPSEEQAAA